MKLSVQTAGCNSMNGVVFAQPLSASLDEEVT